MVLVILPVVLVVLEVVLVVLEVVLQLLLLQLLLLQLRVLLKLPSPIGGTLASQNFKQPVSASMKSYRPHLLTQASYGPKLHFAKF